MVSLSGGRFGIAVGVAIPLSAGLFAGRLAVTNPLLDERIDDFVLIESPRVGLHPTMADSWRCMRLIGVSVIRCARCAHTCCFPNGKCDILVLASQMTAQ